MKPVWGKIFQEEESAGTKSLRQVCAGFIPGIATK